MRCRGDGRPFADARGGSEDRLRIGHGAAWRRRSRRLGTADRRRRTRAPTALRLPNRPSRRGRRSPRPALRAAQSSTTLTHLRWSEARLCATLGACGGRDEAVSCSSRGGSPKATRWMRSGGVTARPKSASMRSKPSAKRRGTSTGRRLTRDWREFLSLLLSHHVRFLLVGGHAVAVHARPRHTEDLDVFVDPTPANAERVHRVLVAFGFGSVAPPVRELARGDRVAVARAVSASSRDYG